MADHVNDTTREEVIGKAHYQFCAHCTAKRHVTIGKGTGNVDTGWMTKRDKPDPTKRDRWRTWADSPVCPGRR